MAASLTRYRPSPIHLVVGFLIGAGQPGIPWWGACLLWAGAWLVLIGLRRPEGTGSDDESNRSYFLRQALLALGWSMFAAGVGYAALTLLG